MNMTEIEARGKIKYRIANEMRKAGENKEEYEDLEIALQVMKEIREYRELGTVEELQALKENKKEYYSDTDRPDGYGYTCTNKTCVERIRAKAIDKFAERLKERLKGMQMVELQGEDVCPCRETGEDCPYMNQDVGCQYCAREQTIKDIDEIAEKMKGGATDES